ncbi:hypothetical protein ACFQGA_09400 [Marinobacter koreensis]|uniref:Uncharacterized protein n=1 Tax=Marinobacter koreensis TaxID=335974 RepID=A0ABW0RL10_9GAMM|nr:hypothetical protein [Marinobacter koreensis]MCK7547161.1 hypothetical protein [Marinobacter koreensis]
MRNEQAAADAALQSAEAFDKSNKLLQKYTGTSADDCRIMMELNAERFPGTTLGEIALILFAMNHQGIEKKAHRQALAKAGRNALNRLAELPA